LPASSPTWHRTRLSARACRQQVLGPRRRSMREAIERARVRGEVRIDLDVELLLDMLTGPFYFSTLFGHASMKRKNTEQIVDCILRVMQTGQYSRGALDNPAPLRPSQPLSAARCPQLKLCHTLGAGVNMPRATLCGSLRQIQFQCGCSRVKLTLCIFSDGHSARGVARLECGLCLLRRAAGPPTSRLASVPNWPQRHRCLSHVPGFRTTRRYAVLHAVTD